jgi:hypothetical protein
MLSQQQYIYTVSSRGRLIKLRVMFSACGKCPLKRKRRNAPMRARPVMLRNRFVWSRGVTKLRRWIKFSSLRKNIYSCWRKFSPSRWASWRKLFFFWWPKKIKREEAVALQGRGTRSSEEGNSG